MKTLKARLKDGLSNCYIMFGDDYELYLRAFNMIYKRAEINLPDFNFIKFDDENYSMQSVVNACEVLPMGDNYRVILVKNVEKISENDKKMLISYLNNPSPNSILVFFDIYGKLGNLKNVQQVDCNKFDKGMLTNIVAREVEKKGKQISGEAIERLIDYCGCSLTRIVGELDKLVYYDLDNPLITASLIEKMVSRDDEVVIYELTEALGQKNGDKAIKCLEKLKKDGILGLITNHFRRLFFISTSGLSDEELANLLSVKEYAIKKQRSQVKNFSKMQLKKIYALLEEVDFMIKSGAMLQENALSYLILSILYI